MTNSDTNQEIDIERVRRETPGCSEAIYLSNCGASLMPEPVYRAVTEHLADEYKLGGYTAQRDAAEKLDDVYAHAAAMFECGSDEIALMENATVAFNAVFYGFARTLRPGDRIFTANAEYASNYIAYLDVAGVTGCEIVEIPDDASGQLDCSWLESMIDERCKLISIVHVPTNGGLVNPAAAVGAIARRHRVPFLLDVCQSAGQMPLDLESLGCDAMTLTGRKFLRGPRGTGILVIRRDSKSLFPPATLDLRGARWIETDRFELAAGARRYENFESNVAGQIGLGVALDYANRIGLSNIQRRVAKLAAMLRDELVAMPGITVRDKGRELCAIVTFTHETVPSTEIQQRLAEAGINVGTSFASSTLLDMRRRGIDSLVRCAPHYFNTEGELSTFLDRLRRIVNPR